MKKLLNFITSRLFAIASLILLQIALLCFILIKFQEYSVTCYLLLVALSIALSLFLVSKRDNPMYKLAWIILILTFPIFGGFFYLVFSKRNVSPKLRSSLLRLDLKTKEYCRQNPKIFEELNQNPVAGKQSGYIYRNALFPVYQNTETVFLTPGENKLAALCEELPKAKKFIFLEYFIIEPGVMWETVLGILVKKVQEGVEVRFMYDDMGCIQTVPSHYDDYLRSLGIKTQVFNPLRPSLDLFMNYRDHRKICVIDGEVGITGGINLADEYINAYEKHGHWKDSSILLRGDAVWNLTLMFLELWESCTGVDEDYSVYEMGGTIYQDDGFVQPFGDSPIDSELTGECVYMNMINAANHSIRIQTPYLILDNEMITALCLSAKNGVDIKIITPHIADKWYVHEVTRANYSQLLDAGVKIYEYTPGFIHAKEVVVDGEYAVVGTSNFDFRSFYLHFECGVWMYRTKTIRNILDDFEKILAVSQEVTPESCKLPWYRAPIRGLLRVFSPLM